MARRLGSSLRGLGTSGAALPAVNPYDELGLGQLVRGLVCLRLSSKPWFAKNAEKLFRISQRTLGERGTGALMRGTFFGHFVAGESEVELARESRRLLEQGRVRLMLCPPMEDLEGDLSIDFRGMTAVNLDKYLDYLAIAERIGSAQDQDPVIQFKHSALFPVQALDLISEDLVRRKVPLLETVEEYRELMQHKAVVETRDPLEGSLKIGLQACFKYFKAAEEAGMPMLLDAELRDSYPVMHAINLAVMSLFSRTRPLHYATFQCYFRDIEDSLVACVEVGQKLGFRFGAKLVRGAYHQTEQLLAAQRGQSSPVFDRREETDAQYNHMVNRMLKEVVEKKSALFVASHNTASIQNARSQMRSLGIKASNPCVNFGQVYGMCDHISYDLGMSGYNVYKSTPWGPVGEWMPYLARRAAENHSAFFSTRNELPLYSAALRKKMSLA